MYLPSLITTVRVMVLPLGIAMSAFARACLALSLVASCASLPTFPNIEYAGVGYNIVLGNPAAESTDPGRARGVPSAASDACSDASATRATYHWQVPRGKMVLEPVPTTGRCRGP